MQIVSILLMILAFGFMTWAVLSLVFAIVRRVRAKKRVQADGGDLEEKGEDD